MDYFGGCQFGLAIWLHAPFCCQVQVCRDMPPFRHFSLSLTSLCQSLSLDLCRGDPSYPLTPVEVLGLTSLLPARWPNRARQQLANLCC